MGMMKTTISGQELTSTTVMTVEEFREQISKNSHEIFGSKDPNFKYGGEIREFGVEEEHPLTPLENLISNPKYRKLLFVDILLELENYAGKRIIVSDIDSESTILTDMIIDHIKSSKNYIVSNN
jgi:hypothetical protein